MEGHEGARGALYAADSPESTNRPAHCYTSSSLDDQATAKEGILFTVHLQLHVLCRSLKSEDTDLQLKSTRGVCVFDLNSK